MTFENTVFRVGDKVNFKGNGKFRPVNGTYIWAINYHLFITYYVQHPEGNITTETLKSNILGDGFEQPHSSNFKEGLKYICIVAEEIVKSEK